MGLLDPVFVPFEQGLLAVVLRVDDLTVDFAIDSYFDLAVHSDSFVAAVDFGAFEYFAEASVVAEPPVSLGYWVAPTAVVVPMADLHSVAAVPLGLDCQCH